MGRWRVPSMKSAVKQRMRIFTWAVPHWFFRSLRAVTCSSSLRGRFLVKRPRQEPSPPNHRTATLLSPWESCALPPRHRLRFITHTSQRLLQPLTRQGEVRAAITFPYRPPELALRIVAAGLERTIELSSDSAKFVLKHLNNLR